MAAEFARAAASMQHNALAAELARLPPPPSEAETERARARMQESEAARLRLPLPDIVPPPIFAWRPPPSPAETPAPVEEAPAAQAKRSRLTPEAIAAAVKQHPDMPLRQLAKLLGVDPHTLRRRGVKAPTRRR
jgi:Helix-turn-helix domain of transposase family ISL3